MKNSVGWGLGLAGIVIVGFGVVWLTQMQSTPTVKELPQVAGSSLSKITLTEVDKNGKLLWEITADKAEYTENNRRAELSQIKGKFFDAGKELIDVVGATGIIDQNSKKIIIEGKVEAIAKKDDVKLKSDRMIWESEQGLLTATGNVKAEKDSAKPNIKIVMVGKLLTAYPSRNLFTISQNVVATSIAPPLKIKSEKLTWNTAKNLVISPNAIAITQTKTQTNLNSDRGQWDINLDRVSLDGNIMARVPESDIDIETSALIWDISKQLVTLDEALKVSSISRQVAIAANTGKANLATQTIRLNGQVKADAMLQQAIINADRVEWIIPTQTITLEGNINYAQAQKSLKVSGSKAIVNLAAQTIKLTGSDVITRITP